MRKFYYFFIKSGLPFLLLNMMILGGAKAIIRTNQNSLDYISLNINEAEISEKVKVDDIPTDPDNFWELIREDLDSGMRSNGNFPPIWDEPSITETIHGYIVPLSSYPRVNDIPLKYGDYIGGFYLLNGERKCGGARMWTGQENIILTLFGDDTSTPEKDGFSYGEVIEFRFFLQDTQKDYIVTTASYYVQTGYVTNGKWYPTSLSMFTNIKSSINLDFYIKFTENPVCVNNQIFFEAVEFIGNGGPYLYEWTSSIAGYYSNSPTPPPLTLEAPIELYLTVSSGNLTSSDQKTAKVNYHPIVDAGPDGQLCENGNYQLSATSLNSSSIEWTSSGDGVFNDPYLESAIYTPGVQDKITGTVNLTITAQPLAPCTATAYDEITLTIIHFPEVHAGEDMSTCGNQPVSLSAQVSNVGSLLWTTSGSGTFSDPNSSTTQYFPSSTDLSTGNNGIILILCAQAISPCNVNICDSINLSFNVAPTALGPTTIKRCEGVTFSLTGAVSNHSSILWTTQGDGTFSNPYVIPTQYTPGPQDIENSGTIVTLNALPIPPCDLPATKNINLYIQQKPRILSFGPDTNAMCATSAFLQLNAEVTGNNGVSWSYTGDGTLSSTNIVNPKYYPGTNDRQQGYFVLTLTAKPKSPCQVGTVESKTFYIQPNPTAFAGNDTIISEGVIYMTDEAIAENYSAIMWQTDGDGVFSNPENLHTSYIHGQLDVYNEFVELTLIAQPINPCAITASDVVILTIEISGCRDAKANAGIDKTICSNEHVCMNDASARHYVTLEWTSDGDGWFDYPNILKPCYYPGENDIFNGNVTLVLNAYAAEGCNNAADTVIIFINKAPTAIIESETVICQGESLSLSGLVQNSTGFQWYTTGDGYFINGQTLSPTYIHGGADLASGMVLICLKALANPGCEDVTECLMITIEHKPVVNAGADQTICENQTYTLNGTAQSYSTVQWQTNGSGTFNNPSILKPVYTPSTADKTAGSVVLTLTAQPISPCAVSASDQMILTIKRLAVANAGSDATICEDATYTLNGTAQRYSSVSWSSSGTGTFNNPSILKPVYTPSAADKIAGSVVLTLTAQPISPCIVSASDQMTLTIQRLATANAGDNVTICENETVTLNGTAQRYSSVSWSSSGTGTFNNPSILKPVYTPSAEDKNTGLVIITLTVQPISPCAVAATDYVIINIYRMPVVSAGNDAAICEDETITLNGTAQRYSSVSWSTSGTGAFNNPSILKPVYTPSAADKTVGSVVLTLTVQPISPCSITASDQMTLFIENLNIIHNLEPTQTVNMGSTLNLVFEVEAHNDGIYTWFFNDEAIENSNNSIFTIPSISATDAGYYLCLFVHNCGEVSSNESFVQVIQLSAHEINLPQLWSGISSYVVPDNPAMNAIFAQIINNIEIVQNYDGIYWPSQNINTLGNWSTTKGYRIKMLNTDQLMISGTVQYPVDELTLPPNWSIIPVNVPCIINTSEFFSDYPSILMIKEIAGSQIYWPEYNINSLVELLPGKAYEIYNSSSQPINITFPLCDGPLMNFEFKSVEPDIIHPWNPIYKTPISHIFGFLPEATGQFEQGDLIGIFTQSDLCAGIAKVEVIDKAFSLTAFGTDIFASDNTGFEYAEPVKFKIFKPTTGQEYPLNIQYSDGADESLFTANGITLIKKAECLMTNVESQSGLVKDFHVYVFPNPTTGNINITLTSNATFDGKFEIINTSGQLIQKVNFKHTNNNTTQSVDLSNNPAGIYYLRIIGENILKTRKILLR